MSKISSGATHESTATAYTARYDRLDDQPLSVAVAEAIADATGTDVTELDPLHYAINTDALERLFEPRPNGVRTGGSVTFVHGDNRVTVDASGEIRVQPGLADV